LLLDALKGLAAVLVVSAIFHGDRTATFVAALGAICGHILPGWLRFRGGKGVATGLGSLLLLAPKAILLAIVLFIAVASIFRYVSLASILAALSVPLFAVLLAEGRTSAEIVLIGTGSLLIVAKHHQNIRRLLLGTEPKFRLKTK
jgi:glycerol-3-phosphate acyltransferase PlsY